MAFIYNTSSPIPTPASQEEDADTLQKDLQMLLLH